MTGPKWSNSSQAVLLLGLPVILLRISVSSAALDGLAARGMRLTSVTQEGCDSFNPLADVTGDRSSCVWLKAYYYYPSSADRYNLLHAWLR